MLDALKPASLRSQYEMARLMAGLSTDVGRAYLRWMTALATHPDFVLRHSLSLTSDYLAIGRDMLLRQESRATADGAGDRRFKSDAWSKSRLLGAGRRFWQATARNALSLAEDTPGLDTDTAQKLRFFNAQLLDALAPSNFAASNPEVLAEARSSRGRSLLAGAKNFWSDLDLRHGRLNISMSDLGAFEVGRDLAITPGKVVYQNDLMQLIQYTPTTKTVARRPLLILPPWLNKFYVLDMQPHNSLVRWLVSQGHTVFLVSWVNPDRRTGHKTFEDYLLEGPLEALDVIRSITGESEVNAMGYCLGGVLLTCAVAWFEAKGQRPIRSATLLTTLVDYSDVGDIKVFVTEDLVRQLERVGRQKGFIPGDNVAWSFRMLRAPDLIWSFVINHYLLGKPRVPFDLLYWNEDATNMPIACHAWYMRNMYLGNRLREPGALQLAGEPIDVTSIRTPTYVLSTRDDHIAPWRTTYETTQLFAGPVRFVLGYSGHIAGVINPPSKVKYGYRVGTRNPADSAEWFRVAKEHQGSWWPDWGRWLKRHAGGQVPARQPGSGEFRPLEDAPGSYVKKTLVPAG